MNIISQGNRADGSSTQQTIFDISNVSNVSNIQVKMFFNKYYLGISSPEMIEKFFVFAGSETPVVEAWRDSTESDHRRSQQGCVPGSYCFLKPSTIIQDLCASAREYPLHVKHVVDLLREDQREKICKSMNSEQPEIVLIEWERRHSSRSDWTTDMTLELMDRLQKDVVLLGHFCGYHGNQDRQIEKMIYNLLTQLREYHQDIFNSHKICQQWSRSEDAQKQVGLFKKCIIGSGFQRVVIILDNIDAIHSSEQSAFLNLIESVRSFSQRDKVVVKLLATSRSSVDTEIASLIRNVEGLVNIELDALPGERR